MRVVFLGPPGSGKGTQAGLLAERLGVPAISTGEILRSAVREGTPLGRQARAVMERGDLVSDDLIVSLIRERTSQPDARAGFILDGYPRTLAQAEALESMLAGNGDAVSAVVNFLVPETELVSRMLGRAKAEGAPTTVRKPSGSACAFTATRRSPSSTTTESATCSRTWTAWAPRRRSPRASTAP